MQNFKTVFFRILFLAAVIASIVFCSSHKSKANEAETSGCINNVSIQYRC